MLGSGKAVKMARTLLSETKGGSRAVTVVRRVKPSPAPAASHTAASLLTLIKLSAFTPGKAEEDGLSVWTLVTVVGDTHDVPGFGLDPALAVVAIGRVNQSMEEAFPLSTLPRVTLTFK